MMGSMTTGEAAFEQRALKAQRNRKLEQFFLEGTTGQLTGVALGIAGTTFAVATAASGVGIVIGAGVALVGARIYQGAKQKEQARTKWEKRLTEPYPQYREAFDKLFEGGTGILVGTGLAAGGAVALATGALPLVGALAAGGAILIGARMAAEAPGKARERTQWENKLLG
jgi:hypothetical protein